MVLLGALGLLALPALVGHLFYRSFAPPEEGDSLSAVLFGQGWVGLSLCAWGALLLAELGCFSLRSLALLLALGSAAVLAARWRNARRWRWPRPQPWAWNTLLVALLFIGIGVLWAYPGEAILGGQDPGVYVSIGASIARSGGIVRHDPWIAALDAPERPLVLRYYLDQWWQTPGFYVTDLAGGEVTPQFLHLYPACLALFYAVGGLDLALLATPLFMLLGLLAVFIFVRRFLGEWPALVAAALLGLNPAL
ncbi:MAG: hypothetical protein JXA37_07035, partial [Chloroflexia bacterium]|nr:hypothetical protein [Chloroflexia bacterium]